MKKRFFDLAKKMSFKSTYYYKVGAVLVKKNRVLNIGFNKTKTHPRSPQPTFKTIHAETDCVLFTGAEDLRGSEIYVYRQFKDGTPATAKPCIHCLSMLVLAGVKRVHYTDSAIGYVTENI